MEEARNLYEAAIIDSDTAIKLDPDRPEPYHIRGVAKAAFGDAEGAIEDFDAAIQINPESAENLLRSCACERGSWAEGTKQKSDFEKAKELDPDVGKMIASNKFRGIDSWNIAANFLFVFLSIKFSPLLCTDTAASNFWKIGRADKGLSARKNKKNL